MQFSNLYDKINYLTDTKYQSGIIREYDLSKANISALFSRGVIDKYMYEDLYNADKKYREIKIGLMIKQDKKIYHEIKKGITDAKKMFFKENNILDYEIISIHNDAVVIHAQRNMIDTFGLYHFVIKGEYTQFFRDFNKTEYYFARDLYTGDDIITIKGISQDTLNRRCQEFMIFIVTFFDMFETESIENVLEYYNKYVQDYLSFNVPLEAYRELNSENMFRLMGKVAGDSFLIDYITKEQLPYIEKGYNYAILRDIGQVLYDKYFSMMQK